MEGGKTGETAVSEGEYGGMKGRIKVEDVGGLTTHYSFRGPKSHRRVVVAVRHGYYARFCEEQALRKANAEFLREWIEQVLGRNPGRSEPIGCS